jgi:hypothetical protein
MTRLSESVSAPQTEPNNDLRDQRLDFNLKLVATGELSMKTMVPFALLLLILVSGCSSIFSNSERYYQNQPRRPINWREYLTD